MKAFIAALIVLGALAFFFTDLPKSATGRLAAAFREQLLPYLKNKTSTFFESKLSSKKQEKSGPELVDAIETNLAELSLAVNGKTKNTKDPEALIQETEELVSELKQNEEPGVVAKTAAMLAEKILPPKFICPPNVK